MSKQSLGADAVARTVEDACVHLGADGHDVSALRRLGSDPRLSEVIGRWPPPSSAQRVPDGLPEAVRALADARLKLEGSGADADLRDRVGDVADRAARSVAGRADGSGT